MKSVHSFSRDEKLKSKKRIEELFKDGTAIKSYPILFLYMTDSSTEEPRMPRVAFVVPKKNCRKAVDRNLIKRRMREAYRLQKFQLKDEQGQSLLAGIDGIFIFLGREVMTYDKIYQKTGKVISKLLNQE